MSGPQCFYCEQSQDRINPHASDRDCLAEALAEIELLSKELLDARAVIRRLTADWKDVGQRLEKAEAGLRQMSEEATLPTDGRLLAKASGVALARDYLRGYGHDR